MLLASGYIRNLDLIPPGSFGRDVCETLAPSRVYAFENYIPAFVVFHPQSTINPVMLIFHDFHDDDEKG